MQERINIGNRLGAMILDHIMMSFAMILFVMPAFVMSIFNDLPQDGRLLSEQIGGVLILYIIGFSVYLNKDFFNGQSGAKRILKMQVIDQNTDQAASPLKCLFRNITLPFWPLEVIFVLINPKRRLGDRIAGTRIEYLESSEKITINWGLLVLVLVLGTIYMSLLIFPLFMFLGI